MERHPRRKADRTVAIRSLPLLLLLLVLLLLLLSSHARGSTVNEPAAGAPRCVHDEIVARQLRGRTRQEAHAAGLLRTTATLRSPERASRAADADSGWEPIRIAVYTEDVTDPSRHCTVAGEMKPTFQGYDDYCATFEVLTAEKQAMLLNTMIPNAIRMHVDRLMVQPLASITIGDAMDYQNGNDPICSSFTVPADVRANGVTDADFILFVAAGVMPAGFESTVAWATTCGGTAEGRPTVGVINVSPRYIDTSEQSERTVAHEIMHALGFSSDLFSELGLVGNAAGLRGKSNVPVLTGPNVIQRTGNQYGCDRIYGGEVDDSGGAGTYGSHWHYRNAKDEMMCGYVSPAMRYSALSIAAMEDTGFYKGNYANAEYMDWGFNAGCDLLNEKCLVSATSQFPEMFCDESGTLRCTSDHSGVGTCEIGWYPNRIPEEMQYFPGYPNLGGLWQADYCPLFFRDEDMYLCSSGSSAFLGGSYIGAGSRCVDVAANTQLTMPICVNTRCDDGARTFQVQFLGGSDFVDCPAGTIVDASRSSSTFTAGSNIVCPPYESICPTVFNSTAITVTQLDHGDGSAAARNSLSLAVVVALALWASTCLLLA